MKIKNNIIYHHNNNAFILTVIIFMVLFFTVYMLYAPTMLICKIMNYKIFKLC